MARGRIAVTIELSASERCELEGLTRRRRTAQGLARRARIVLLAAEGHENKKIAGDLDTTPDTVGKWRRRFDIRRTDGLYDEPPVRRATVNRRRCHRRDGAPHA